MKIERLLAIITYLLNRDLVTCKTLAEKFEVTERTIQRDIESINLAGIPVVSIRGSSGGYQILDTFKFSKQPISSGDMSSIKLALETLNTASIRDYSNLVEKVESIEGKASHHVSVDMGVARENDLVQDNYKIIETAIQDNRVIEFKYTNALNQESFKRLEPLKLTFKWYAWYMIGYSDKYKIYKLARMNDISLKGFYKTSHPSDIEGLLADKRAMTRLTIKCHKTCFVSFNEYFHRLDIISKDHDHYLVSLDVIESERMWFGLLLSFGDDIEILSPRHIRQRVHEQVCKIKNLYTIPDN